MAPAAASLKVLAAETRRFRRVSAARTQGGAVGGGWAKAAAAGVVVDRLLGEPKRLPHPVAVFGAVMEQVERRIYRDSRPAGVVHAVIGVGAGAAAGATLRSTAACTAMAVAGRGLGSAATEVAAALAGGDLEAARSLLPALVGRDPRFLDEKEIARAVVESVAENTVDAVVAPALWAAVAGAPGVLAYRALNTLDAMVGYRHERYRRYGWASARLDDVAAWVPARVTALLVAAVRPASAPRVWRAVLDDAPSHPSPNAGVAEAAFAAALGLRLGGLNRYEGGEELMASLGTGRPPEAADIARAVRLCEEVSLALAALLFALGTAAGRRRLGGGS